MYLVASSSRGILCRGVIIDFGKPASPVRPDKNELLLITIIEYSQVQLNPRAYPEIVPVERQEAPQVMCEARTLKSHQVLCVRSICRIRPLIHSELEELASLKGRARVHVHARLVRGASIYQVLSNPEEETDLIIIACGGGIIGRDRDTRPSGAYIAHPVRVVLAFHAVVRETQFTLLKIVFLCNLANVLVECPSNHRHVNNQCRCPPHW